MGLHLWGRTESDTTAVTSQQQHGGEGAECWHRTQLCCGARPAVLGAASLHTADCCSHLEVSVLAELAESLVYNMNHSILMC